MLNARFKAVVQVNLMMIASDNKACMLEAGSNANEIKLCENAIKALSGAESEQEVHRILAKFLEEFSA